MHAKFRRMELCKIPGCVRWALQDSWKHGHFRNESNLATTWAAMDNPQLKMQSDLLHCRFNDPPILQLKKMVDFAADFLRFSLSELQRFLFPHNEHKLVIPRTRMTVKEWYSDFVLLVLRGIEECGQRRWCKHEERWCREHIWIVPTVAKMPQKSGSQERKRWRAFEVSGDFEMGKGQKCESLDEDHPKLHESLDRKRC